MTLVWGFCINEKVPRYFKTKKKASVVALFREQHTERHREPSAILIILILMLLCVCVYNHISRISVILRLFSKCGMPGLSGT